MQKICRIKCKKYDKCAKKYDKYAMLIYYGKYAIKILEYAKSADHAKKMQICTPRLTDTPVDLAALASKPS
jgi:predicted transcriptional regulator